jgi:two-component system NtrC family sensor kinase
MINDHVSILCVDDEPGILAALRRVLCDDFTILTATSAEDGVQLLKDHPGLAAVMSDHRMPGINGFDFLTWCRTNYPNVARIALTGYPDSDLMKEALRNGLAVQVVSKPWDDGQIIQTIVTAIQQPGGMS